MSGTEINAARQGRSVVSAVVKLVGHDWHRRSQQGDRAQDFGVWMNWRIAGKNEDRG
jgi:hypothetical protein